MSLKLLLLRGGCGGKDIRMTFQQFQNLILTHRLKVEVCQSFVLGRFHGLSISGA